MSLFIDFLIRNDASKRHKGVCAFCRAPKGFDDVFFVTFKAQKNSPLPVGFMSDFYKISHTLHENSYSNIQLEKEIALYENWFEKGTTDVWRHLRMLEYLKVFIKSSTNSSWLTVGDGKFGTSAMYIQQQGGTAVATDIDASLLKIAHERGWIKAFAKENAEQISYNDNSFDFVFCKEAFHHFPRAYLALYEMIRVCKTAVILTEPNDWLPLPLGAAILQKLKNGIKKITGGRIPNADEGNFEDVGNYIFTVSEREMRKIAGGMGLPCTAFKEYTDVYMEGVETEKALADAPLLKKIKRKLSAKRIRKFFGLVGDNRIVAVIFKSTPNEQLRNELRKAGFKIVDTPANPYLKK